MNTSSDPTATKSKSNESAQTDFLDQEENEQQQQSQQQQHFRLDDNHNNNTSSSSNSSNLLSGYLKFLDRQSPTLLVKCITSAVIGALGGAVGSYLAALSQRDDTHKTSRTTTKRSRQQVKRIDWVDVLSFAIYGGFVGGPLGHYWDEWLKEHGPTSRSNAMLLDQLIAQPPRLLLMYIVLDLTRVALHELPASLHRTWSVYLSPAVALSWRVWPIATYLVLRLCNNNKNRQVQQRQSRFRRRLYTMAIHSSALLFVTELARKRQLVMRQSRISS